MPKIEVKIEYEKLQEVIVLLERRITERFPDGSEPGILERMRELSTIASAAPKVRQRITSPLWVFRLIVSVAIAFVGYIGYQYAGEVKLSFKDSTVFDILEAANSAWSLGFAILMLIMSLFLWERNWKRSIAIRYMDQLTSLSLVINLAQMTKDPERFTFSKEQTTKASPSLGGCTTPFLLNRWLDYAGEMVNVLSCLSEYVAAGVTDSAITTKLTSVGTATRTTTMNLSQKALTLATLFAAKQKEEPVSAS